MPETTPDPRIAPLADQPIAEVVEMSEGRQCTIYPANVDDVDLVTTWITADEDSFVALADVR